MNLENHKIKKIYNFIIHPLTLLVISSLISLAFYIVDLRDKKPYYYLSPVNLIASKTDENLKILYKEKEIPNIYSTNLTIWNGGNQIIDYSDFVSDQPIKLHSKNVKILSVSLSNKSRNNLKFSSQINNDTIIIRLMNDEAIEKFDGANFLILFTKENNHNLTFNLTSRVKETKNGFIHKEILSPTKKDLTITTYILWAILIIMIGIRILTLKIAKQNIVFRNKELIFLLILGAFAIYYSYIILFVQTALPWLQIQ